MGPPAVYYHDRQLANSTSSTDDNALPDETALAEHGMESSGRHNSAVQRRRRDRELRLGLGFHTVGKVRVATASSISVR